MSLKEWKPTKRQEDFLEIPDTVFEGLYGGAAGGGKTEVLLMLPIVKKTKLDKPLYTHPRFKMLYLRRTFPELDNEVIPRSKEFYTAAGFYPFQDQKKRWTHSSGAIVQFGHCEYEKDVAKYDTSEYTIIVFDEATSFTPYQYNYLTFSWCRTASPDLTAFVRSGTNPGNLGHSYFRKRFIEPCKTGNVILRETREILGKSQTILRIFIPSKVQDNPHLITNDPGYVARLNKLPEKDRAAKADGDWWAYSGQVFGDFRENHITGEPANALHVVDPFPIPLYWARILSIDWGYSAMMIAGWYAINPVPSPQFPAKVYKYREYTALKTNISTWAEHVRKLSGNEIITSFVLDPSAWGHRGDEYTIAEQVMQYTGMSPKKADNDRISGKLLLQEYLRWVPRPASITPEKFDHETAQKIYEKGGYKAFQDYQDLFKPQEIENLLPKFQIFDTCTETIKTLPLCNYKKDKDKPSTSSDDEGNSEDVEEFRGDDPYDETRYGIKECQFYLENGKSEHARIEQVAKICSVVEQGRPSPSQLTHFYRQMADLEASERFMNQPVRRFHGNRKLR